MDQPNVLRTTKIGGGFVKEDVLAYVDELNSQIYALQEERDELKKKAQSGGSADAEMKAEYEAELSRLRGELGTTKNQLRAAQDELKNRPVIDSTGAGVVTEDAFAAAQQEAVDAKADLASAQAELELAQEEQTELKNQITELESRLTTLNEDNETLRQDLAEAAAQALTGGGADSEAVAQQIADFQAQLSEKNSTIETLEASAAETAAELETLRAELEAKNTMIEETAGLSSESDLQKLAEYEAVISEQSSSLAEKDRELEQLRQENADLKEKGGDAGFDMSALFMEAQMTAKKVATEANKKAAAITKDAEEKAAKAIADANAQAEQTIADANAQAEQTIADANKQADETISNANAEAEKKLNDADAQAIKTVADAEESVRASIEDAERRTKTTTETARTVRALLRSEIDSVSKKFNEISLVLENLSGQAGSRLSEAKNVISEARSTVGDDDDVPSFESFDEVASKSFEKVGKSEFNFDDLAESVGDNGSGWN
ncbi:MAG: hypothetical protein J6S92_04365 [Oscillospiraceae bacterium]|nr:hypothetical protein [Oscillospiraceae bacterium]